MTTLSGYTYIEREGEREREQLILDYTSPSLSIILVTPPFCQMQRHMMPDSHCAQAIAASVTAYGRRLLHPA